MALPARYNIPVWAGNTLQIQFNLKDENGDPFDLTGSKMVFRCTPVTGTIRKDSDDGTGLEITDAINGQVSLTLSVEETRSMPQSKIKYELERWIGGLQNSVLFGELDVTVWVNDDVDP